MTNATTRGTKTLRLERTYEAPLQDVWDLWATKEGFESWWGPEGFRVEVHELDLRVGGRLSYDMIASRQQEIEYMKSQGMPLSHGTHGTFVEVEPMRCLAIRHIIDFIPGLASYDNDMRVELSTQGASVRMVVTIQEHRDPMWTERAVAGFESQLTKVPAALAARAAQRAS